MWSCYVFNISLAILAYILAGYPIIIYIKSRFNPAPVKRESSLRPFSVILCARNEEIHIRNRLDNLLAMDYPPDLYEIIVVSDGSTDETDKIVQAYADKSIKLVRLGVPGGKAAALNAGIQQAAHDILLLCDARQHFQPDVARRLVSYFGDTTVGAVSGRLIICPPSETSAASGVSPYWNYEVKLRSSEAISDSVIGATGAIYAFRKALFKELPEGTVLDDVLIPMRIVLQGKRVLYDDAAIALDEKPVTNENELTRKVRTLYGNLQLYRIAPELFSPIGNRLWWRFISHKMLRLMLPFLFIICLFSSLFAGGGLSLLGIAQLCCWIASFLAWKIGATGCLGRALSSLLLLNAAVVIAWYRFLTGRNDVWKASSSHHSIVN